jgi:hypothetical protein
LAGEVAQVEVAEWARALAPPLVLVLAVAPVETVERATTSVPELAAVDEIMAGSTMVEAIIVEKLPS